MTTANIRSQLDKRFRETLREIIDGKTTEWSKHELTVSGIDISNVFIEEMDKKNYLPAVVGDVACIKGQCVPAFYIEERQAYFGWVFWERLIEGGSRKLFGSVVRNENGESS